MGLKRRAGMPLSLRKVAVLVFAFGAIGLAALVVSSAATYVASSEAESGIRTGNAVTVSGSGASGGQAVQFKQSSTCNKPTPTTASAYEQLLRGNINGKWYHGDAGQSVKLPDGRVLWTYGDTWVGAAGQTRGSTFVNNTGLLTDAGCITPITGPIAGGKETTWITPNAQTDTPGLTDYYWPNTPFMDGSVLRLFLSHMYSDNSGFHPIGIDLATFTLTSNGPVLQSVTKTPASAAGTTSPLWGGAVITKSDGFHYIFGSVNKNEQYVLGHYQYLARVQVGQVGNQSSWQYWNGSGWVSNQSAAVAIIPGVAGIGVGHSAYTKANGETVIVTKKYDNLGTDIYAWKAANITGPYTERQPALLAPIPRVNFTNKDLTYAALAHPHAQLSSGKLLVSYSRNSEELSFFGDIRYGNYFVELAQP